MIATPLATIRIPEPHATKLRHKIINPMSPAYYSDATELIAYIEGKEVDELLVKRLLEAIPSLPQHPVIPSPVVSIKGRDGKVISVSKSTMCRRFHFFDDFFDDFFTEFPDTTEVEVPFDGEELLFVLKQEREAGTFIRLARSIISLFRDEEEKLIDHIDCLSYFNPKSALEYFSLSTIGMSSERLIDLHTLLTDKEKKEILDTHYNTGGPPLPNRGLGIDTLALILVSHEDVESLSRLFSDYPSFLCYAFYEMDKMELVDYLLLTANFTDVQPKNAYNEKYVKDIIIRVFTLMSSAKDWETVSRLLTMLTLCCEEYNNKDEYIPFIVHVERADVLLDDYIGHRVMRGRAAANISRLHPGGISEEKARWALEYYNWVPFIKA